MIGIPTAPVAHGESESKNIPILYITKYRLSCTISAAYILNFILGRTDLHIYTISRAASETRKPFHYIVPHIPSLLATLELIYPYGNPLGIA